MPDVDIPPLAEELLYSMTGSKRLWDHQAAAWKKMFRDQESVILCGPYGSGKKTWARLAAVKEVIQRSGGVLYIMPSRQLLKAEVNAFRAAIKNSSVRFNIAVYDASAPEFLSQDAAKDIPLLVLADPDSIGDVLLKHWRQFSTFWCVLSRIIISDISELTSVRAGNFYYYLRRLMIIRQQENSRAIKICGLCSRITAAMEDEIEKLLGMSMSFITADSAPAVPVMFYGIQSGTEDDIEADQDIEFIFSRPASLATMLGAGIRKEGFNVYYDPQLVTRHRLEHEHTMGSWSPMVQPNPDPLSAATSILYVDQHNLFDVIGAVRHYGALSAEGCHVCFLLFSHNPLVQYFLLHPEKFMPGATQQMYRHLIFYHRNRVLIKRHIEESLENMPMDLPQLTTIFGNEIREIIDKELSLIHISEPTRPY